MNLAPPTTTPRITIPGHFCREFEVINARKKSKRSYKNSGFVVVEQCWLEAVPTFLDFIQGGCELNCTIAIDFTVRT